MHCIGYVPMYMLLWTSNCPVLPCPQNSDKSILTIVNYPLYLVHDIPLLLWNDAFICWFLRVLILGDLMNDMDLYHLERNKAILGDVSFDQFRNFRMDSSLIEEDELRGLKDKKTNRGRWLESIFIILATWCSNTYNKWKVHIYSHVTIFFLLTCFLAFVKG